MMELRFVRPVCMLTAAGLLVGAALPALATGTLRIEDTHLQTPPDSHEPQRALIDLRNTGPDPMTATTILCAFTGVGGAVLDTQTVSVPAIAGGATAQAEAIYYGYPRAGGAACRVAEPR